MCGLCGCFFGCGRRRCCRRREEEFECRCREREEREENRECETNMLNHIRTNIYRCFDPENCDNNCVLQRV